MKIVEMLGERNLQVVELPEPEPRDDFVVIKVMASTICGTEARTYHDPRSPEYAHYNSGHEATGLVWNTAPGARIAEGTRVAVHCDLGQHCGRCENCYRGDWLRCLDPRPIISDWRGTHSQYILRRESECMALPDDVPFEIGSTLVDCAGTPYRGIRRLGVDGFDTVLITGLGPLGAAAAIICDALGATVIATEPAEYRLARAAEYGVDHPINPNDGDALARVMSLTAGRGVDVAMDFTGYTEPQLLCLDGVRSGGAVGFLGLKYDDTPDGPVPRPHSSHRRRTPPAQGADADRQLVRRPRRVSRAGQARPERPAARAPDHPPVQHRRRGSSLRHRLHPAGHEDHHRPLAGMIA